MTTRAAPANPKSSKSGGVVLGRSSATGRFVLSPATKGGSVSIDKVRAIVASVIQSKKK